MIKNNRSAFTLAEMMIVMLILTILLAAFAPIMTKKSKVDLSSPWRWSNNNSDIYYGMGNNQTAMIGQNNKANGDLAAKLLINIGGNDNRSHILFKNNNTTLGNLIYNGNNILFGGPYTNNFSGTLNTAFGNNALPVCTDANCSNNTAFGYQSMLFATKSMNNTAIGLQALWRHTESSQDGNLGNNVSIGTFSLHGIDGGTNTGYNNTAVGSEAGRRITSGHDNTAIGFASGGAGGWAGEVANTGSNNTSLGSSSLISNTSGSNNIAIGVGALEHSTITSGNIAIGYNALKNSDDTSGNAYRGKSIAIGEGALQNTTSGFDNIAIGHNALLKNTTGYGNIAIGNQKYGVYNGRNLMDSRAPLSELTSGSGNLVIAAGGINSTPASLSMLTSGNQNIAIGSGSLYGLSQGSNNIVIGNNSCNKNITGTNIICIGNNIYNHVSGAKKKDDETMKNIIFLGSESDTVYISGNLVVRNNAVLNRDGGRTWFRDNEGNFGRVWRSSGSVYTDTASDVIQAGRKVGFAAESTSNDFNYWVDSTHSSVSDKRLKNIKGENTAGLEQIKKLKVFDYTFKKDEKKTPRVGVIAQDLQKVFPSAVTTGDDGYLKIRKEDMFYAAINAIKELDKMLQDVIVQVKTLATQVANHDAQIKALQKENTELKTKVQALEKQNKSFEDRLKAIEKKL